MDTQREFAVQAAEKHLDLAVRYLKTLGENVTDKDIQLLLLHIEGAKTLLETLPIENSPKADSRADLSIPIRRQPNSPLEYVESEKADTGRSTTSTSQGFVEQSDSNIYAVMDSLDTPPEEPKSSSMVSGLSSMPAPQPDSPRRVVDTFSRTTALNESHTRTDSSGLGGRLAMIPSLSKGMSLNDRKFYTSELFAGDPKILRRVVEEIDGKENLSDAIQVLHGYYVGDMDNPALCQFISLLERRFS